MIRESYLSLLMTFRQVS
ncbi:hypothetical protein [Rhizobium gallicum]